jgi:molybdopterin synthase catalytic subunit
MAEAELSRLRAEALDRFGLLRCAIHHRIGVVPLTEAAVVVGTASAHRKEAFEAALWIMDEIKKTVPIWKRERYSQGGEAWVEGIRREG